MTDSFRISSFRIELQWKKISRSQSAVSRSKSSIYVELRPKPAIWYMEFVWDTGKCFWQSTSSNRFLTDTLSRYSSLYESKWYRWKHRAEEYREICCMTRHQENKQRTKSRLQLSMTILNCAMSIMLRRTRSLLHLVRCSTFLKTTKQ